MTLSERLTKMETTLAEIKGLLTKQPGKLPYNEQEYLNAVENTRKGNRWAVYEYNQTHERKI